MTLSPARSALVEHQKKIIAAAAAIETARRPLLELKDRTDAAGAALRNAESPLAALLAAEAEDIVTSGPRGTSANFTAKIAAASAEIERRKRALDALQAKMDELRRPLADAELTAGVIASATEPLIAAVIANEADSALAEFAAAQVTAAAAEAKVRTLVAHIVSKKWLALAERISLKLNTAPPATWTTQSFPDWPALTAALVTDPHAVAEVPQ